MSTSTTRQLIAAMQVTLDGRILGPADEVDWVDSWADGLELLPPVDAFVLGGGMFPDYEHFWATLLHDPPAAADLLGRDPYPRELTYARTAAETRIWCSRRHSPRRPGRRRGSLATSTSSAPCGRSREGGLRGRRPAAGREPHRRARARRASPDRAPGSGRRWNQLLQRDHPARRAGTRRGRAHRVRPRPPHVPAGLIDRRRSCVKAARWPARPRRTSTTGSSRSSARTAGASAGRWRALRCFSSTTSAPGPGSSASHRWPTGPTEMAAT